MRALTSSLPTPFSPGFSAVAERRASTQAQLQALRSTMQVANSPCSSSETSSQNSFTAPLLKHCRSLHRRSTSLNHAPHPKSTLAQECSFPISPSSNDDITLTRFSAPPCACLLTTNGKVMSAQSPQRFVLARLQNDRMRQRRASIKLVAMRRSKHKDQAARDRVVPLTQACAHEVPSLPIV